MPDTLRNRQSLGPLVSRCQARQLLDGRVLSGGQVRWARTTVCVWIQVWPSGQDVRVTESKTDLFAAKLGEINPGSEIPAQADPVRPDVIDGCLAGTRLALGS